jgi:predicted nucleotide-binding protein (sugar kinase/HSP70/actin superfamily)
MSPARIAFELRRFIQRKDEYALMRLFEEDFHGHEEPAGMKKIFERSRPYLPSTAALGEMVINVGRAVYLYEKGVDGIVDISPFTCMNAIVTEAIYPKISRDHDTIPIRVFYFDGKARDWGQDVEMFMELVRDYRSRKRRNLP